MEVTLYSVGKVRSIHFWLKTLLKCFPHISIWISWGNDVILF
jgi:hypothetical protein